MYLFAFYSWQLSGCYTGYMSKINYGKLSLSLVFSLSAGILGSIFTTQSVVTWYPTLLKPSWNPPSFVFGPVWTLLYILIGISLYLVWNQGHTVKVNRVLWVFYLQLLLNAFWSYLFFGAKFLWLAYFEILFLLVAIVFNLFMAYKLNKTAGWLLFPYFLWVCFASVLNFTVASLN